MNHPCAFCGSAVQLDNTDLALEAAHIRRCQFGGPDTTDNGLACCSIHHQAFDRGAITISNELRILVSSRLHGAGRMDDFFLAPTHASERQLLAIRLDEDVVAWFVHK